MAYFAAPVGCIFCAEIPGTASMSNSKKNRPISPQELARRKEAAQKQAALLLNEPPKTTGGIRWQGGQIRAQENPEFPPSGPLGLTPKNISGLPLNRQGRIPISVKSRDLRTLQRRFQRHAVISRFDARRQFAFQDRVIEIDMEVRQHRALGLDARDPFQGLRYVGVAGMRRIT